MQNQINEIKKEYQEITNQLSTPSIVSDPQKMAQLGKRQAELQNVISVIAKYEKIEKEMKGNAEIMNSENDPELKEMAMNENIKLSGEKEKTEKEMEALLVPKDPNDPKNVIVEIRAGAGGDESSLFAAQLFRMYSKYAEKNNWLVSILNSSQTELGGFKEIVFEINGKDVFGKMKYESGVHRVQRVPETEAQGRIHTSAATVAVLPEPEEVDIQINPDDVVEQVCRSSGPGGQKVNKTSSAIRLEHIPTGITVRMQEEKSQHKNRAKAWRILRGRLYEFYESKRVAEREAKRKIMIGSGDRSEKIRTYNFPQNRVTDHRINLSLYTLDKIIAGEAGELFKALKEHDIQERLKNL